MSKYTTPEHALAAKYPFAAIPSPAGDGWEIVFPDIAGVVGFSETWEGIGPEAELILSEWITGEAEDGHPIPSPSPDWDPIEVEPSDFRLPEVYSSDEVAEMLGVSVRRVQALAKDRQRGKIVGNSLVFTLDDVAAMRPGKPGRPRKVAAAV